LRRVGVFDPGKLQIGYNDLVYNDDPNVYVKIGGTDTGANAGHGSTAYNRYMQNTPSWQINAWPH